MTEILAAYRRLLAEVDAWFARCQAAYPREIRCVDGCSGCCRGLFDITLLDARLLRTGFDRLPATTRSAVLEKAHQRLTELQQLWLGFGPPYLLNHLPDSDWTAMPEDDPTPCPLLDAHGRCLVYEWRPMICRTHGLPQIDLHGEIFSEEWCTRNFVAGDPRQLPALRADFRALYEREFRLLQEFAAALTGVPGTELDTFIPLALLIDFDGFD